MGRTNHAQFAVELTYLLGAAAPRPLAGGTPEHWPSEHLCRVIDFMYGRAPKAGTAASWGPLTPPGLYGGMNGGGDPQECLVH